LQGRSASSAYPLPAGWVAGDEACGGDPDVRDWLEECPIGHACAERCDTEVTIAVGRHVVEALAALVPDHRR